MNTSQQKKRIEASLPDEAGVPTQTRSRCVVRDPDSCQVQDRPPYFKVPMRWCQILARIFHARVQPRGVAQIFNLLYRRIVFGKAVAGSRRLEMSRAWQIANPSMTAPWAHELPARGCPSRSSVAG